MMRHLRLHAHARITAAAAACLLMTGGPADAYLKVGIQSGTQHFSIKWSKPPAVYYVNEEGLPGISTAGYRTALDRAFAAWQNVPTSSISFQFGGTTTAGPLDADGLTTIGFLPRPDLDRVLGSTGFIIDNVTGQIIEAGVFFNSVFPWSVADGGEAGKYDFQSIALHEIGHLAGLGHSALGETELNAGGRHVLGAESVMFPIAFSAGSIAGRELKADDIAGISDIYPDGTFAADTGSLNGRVTKSGQGVYGAHVVAFNSSTGKLVGNFTLDSQGAFAIAGLDPGVYVVRVEPLDDADVSAFFADPGMVDLAFQVTYLDRLAVVPKGGNAGPYEIKVTPR